MCLCPRCCPSRAKACAQEMLIARPPGSSCPTGPQAKPFSRGPQLAEEPRPQNSRQRVRGPAEPHLGAVPFTLFLQPCCVHTYHQHTFAASS